MQRKRRQEVSEKLYRLARAGGSVHQILTEIPNVTYAEAEAAIKEVSEDNKAAGPAHRSNLRNVIREQAMGAISVIYKVANEKETTPAIRLRAAETLLKYACDFMDETVMRSWQERPDTSVELQPTIFDFGPVIEENGEISFRGESRLMLVPPTDD